jgi:hypothetical protein
MEQITIGFSRPKKWKPFAWLIMKSYNTPYDHVYVCVHSNSYDRDLIYQASSTMVNFMSTSVFEANNVIVAKFDVNISQASKKALMQFAIDNVGKSYGIKEVVGLAWVRLNELCGKTIKNPFKDSGTTYVCSELVSTILVDFNGIELNKDVEDMTPLDVYNVLMSLNNKV